jgi:hypothetical protein
MPCERVHNVRKKFCKSRPPPLGPPTASFHRVACSRRERHKPPRSHYAIDRAWVSARARHRTDPDRCAEPFHWIRARPSSWVRQILGAVAQFEKAALVAKLRHARERIRAERRMLISTGRGADACATTTQPSRLARLLHPISQLGREFTSEPTCRLVRFSFAAKGPLRGLTTAARLRSWRWPLSALLAHFRASRLRSPDKADTGR